MSLGGASGQFALCLPPLFPAACPPPYIAFPTATCPLQTLPPTCSSQPLLLSPLLPVHWFCPTSPPYHGQMSFSSIPSWGMEHIGVWSLPGHAAASLGQNCTTDWLGRGWSFHVLCAWGRNGARAGAVPDSKWGWGGRNCRGRWGWAEASESRHRVGRQLLWLWHWFQAGSELELEPQQPPAPCLPCTQIQDEGLYSPYWMRKEISSWIWVSIVVALHCSNCAKLAEIWLATSTLGIPI